VILVAMIARVVVRRKMERGRAQLRAPWLSTAG
jgi:hypothetical protein